MSTTGRNRPLPAPAAPRSIPDLRTVAFVNITGTSAGWPPATAAGTSEPATHAPTDAVPGDLRAATGPDPSGWQVPAGWEPVADIARRVLADIDPLVDRITDAVVVEITPYRADLVPRDDLRGSVLRNLEALVAGLAERRSPTARERDVRRELGTRRALQGIAVDAVIKAYHVGYRELWQALVAALPPGDEEATTKLLTGATIVWQWVHEVTDAIAAAHAATTRTLEARAVGARQRFIELLVAGDLGGSEARRLVRALDLDQAGGFQVLNIHTTADDLDAVDLQHSLDTLPGRHAVASRGAMVIVVVQDGDIEQVATTIRRRLPDGSIAIGAARPGLPGARASLEDAEQTAAITGAGQVMRFEDAWLWATLAGADERLSRLLAPGRTVADEHPHLVAAVQAFAAAGFSVSAAARSLGLHANTVGYRLDRWHELTGWDPRTFAGLTRSVAALGPVGQRPGDGGRPPGPDGG